MNLNTKISILNLAQINMKKTRITITHQLEKSQHHFMVVNPDKLTSLEVDKIKKVMGVEMVFVNGRLFK
jgi:hypothetical protein